MHHDQTLPTRLLAFALCLVGLCHGTHSQPAPQHQPERTFDTMVASLTPNDILPYKTINDRQLTLHLFKPQDWSADDRRPAHVVIHGGGWRNFSPKRFYPYANSLVDQGYVGISVEYRLASKNQKQDNPTTVFDSVKDARAAVRYIRKHADELGIDPNRIAVGGGSAGAHLALSTALFDEIDHEGEDKNISCRPDALILYFAVLDTSPEGYGNAFIGPRWKELSPRHHINKNMPPTLIFHGDRDSVAKMPILNDFCKRLKDNEVPYELILEKNGVHGHLNRDLKLFDAAIPPNLELPKPTRIQRQRVDNTQSFQSPTPYPSTKHPRVPRNPCERRLAGDERRFTHPKHAIAGLKPGLRTKTTPS